MSQEANASGDRGGGSKTDALMASLMGGGGFLDDGDTTASAPSKLQENGTAGPPSLPPQPPPAASMRATSDSAAASGNGGGLFDDIPVGDDPPFANMSGGGAQPPFSVPVSMPMYQQSLQPPAPAAAAAPPPAQQYPPQPQPQPQPPFQQQQYQQQPQQQQQPISSPPQPHPPATLPTTSGYSSAGGGGGQEILPGENEPPPFATSAAESGNGTTAGVGGGPSGLLAASGLLGFASTMQEEGGGSSGGGGGLFDDIDKEEEEKERLRREEEERKRREAEEAAAAAAAEERRLREEQQRREQEEEQKRRQQQQEEAAERLRIQQEQQLQQQQITDQMQSVHVSTPTRQPGVGGYMNDPNNNNANPMYASYPNPQQQYQQQQQQPMYGSMQQPSSTNMQQQAPQQQYKNYNNYGPPQQQPQQPQPQQQQQYEPQTPQPQQPVQAGFYRDHSVPGVISTAPMSPGLSSVTGIPRGPNSNVYGGQPTYPQQQQGQQPPYNQQPYGPGAVAGIGGGQNRFYQPPQQPNLKAGMYNAQPGMGQVVTRPLREPPPVMSPYSKVVVTDPLLVQGGGGGFLGIGGTKAPHWSYLVVTEFKPAQPGMQPPPAWTVRRRFRHVVALEDRLRHENPGAILAPRPDKHATRAIEEASAQQSAEFAVQRAAELELYLNQLVHHPVLVNSHGLRLFLSLQDDLGTAWPEVSSNALTRLANAGVGAAVSLSESTAATKFPWQDGAGLSGMDEYSEDNAELLALQSSEAVRMGAVLQAVPKLEGAVTLLREHAEQSGSVGMELSRLVKELTVDDRELAAPIEIMANGMLRSGRRSKRLSLELSAAMHTFTQQYKLCRYEKAAFSDRKLALVKRSKERGKADHRAQQLMYQQRQHMYQYQQAGPYGANPMDRMERDAVVSDEIAVDAVQECAEIGERLKSEVNRIAWQRRTEWHAAVKVVASAMKEATSERLSIWESVREQYLQAFP